MTYIYSGCRKKSQMEKMHYVRLKIRQVFPKPTGKEKVVVFRLDNIRLPPHRLGIMKEPVYLNARIFIVVEALGICQSRPGRKAGANLYLVPQTL